MQALDRKRYSPIIFVVAASDKLSLERLSSDDNFGEQSPSTSLHPDASVTTPQHHSRNVIIETIHRSREVGQSYWTSLISTLMATFSSMRVLISHRPNFILVNGPGSCVPVCLCAILLRILALSDTRTTFVESLCRVQRLSLTGKILYWFVDDFIVQWPELQKKYPRSKYLGRLV